MKEIGPGVLQMSTSWEDCEAKPATERGVENLGGSNYNTVHHVLQDCTPETYVILLTIVTSINSI